MTTTQRRSGATSAVDTRNDSGERPSISGVVVRADDIESVKGIRTIAGLFRGMAIILLLLAALQVFFAVTSTVPLSIGVVVAEVVRLVIFAGLLWGVGDLAVLAIRSHYDIRATKILTARMEYMMRHVCETDGTMPPGALDAHAPPDRGT
jgi:hypothetical protein